MICVFGEDAALLDSKALTKIQSITLITIILLAAVSGGAVYVLLSGEKQILEPIKIGILTDLDLKPNTMNGAILAAEEINNQGGVLGRHFEIIGEDSDVFSENYDPYAINLALTRLITYHKVDFVIARGGENILIETAAEHKKILIGTSSPSEALTQRVIDDYEKYKYFFRISLNETAYTRQLVDSLVHLREITGLNKVAYLGAEVKQIKVIKEVLDYSLPEEHGFELVYRGSYPWGETLDFSSYFAAAEAAGAEIMVPLMITEEGLIFAKEWYDRQSPMVVWGMNSFISDMTSWNVTEGKVEHMTGYASSVLELGYQVTSKTVLSQEAYLKRWGELPNQAAIVAYDCIRFLLYDALQRAQTTETEAVIKALEESEIENSLERNFKFTSSHDHYIGPGNELMMMFQWQENETWAIVYPKQIMEETGATYTFPPWPGPWGNLNSS